MSKTITQDELEYLAFHHGTTIEFSRTHAYTTVGGITYRAEMGEVAA